MQAVYLFEACTLKEHELWTNKVNQEAWKYQQDATMNRQLQKGEAHRIHLLKHQHHTAH